MHSTTTGKKGKDTTIADGEKRLVATADWDHSSAVMDSRGRTMKIKDFMPFTKKAKASGTAYKWIEDARGDVVLSQANNPSHALGLWRDPNQIIELELYTGALHAGILQECLGYVLHELWKAFRGRGRESFMNYTHSNASSYQSRGLGPGFFGALGGASFAGAF